jgi:hypothetical protein
MAEPDPVSFLQQIAAPPAPRARYRLADINAAIQAAMATPSDAGDAALLALMSSPRPIPFAPGSPRTHSMPPDDLIKQLIAQILLRRDPRKYRPHVEQLRDGATTARFRRLIDGFLARAP